MTFHVEYSDDARKSLLKMKKKDPTEALRIFNWIGKNIEGCEDPRRTGKALTGQFKGSWRYRVGNYRILAEIKDEKLVILLIDIDHRSTVYLD
ncbi:type II toxin-antitoxin system RelE/ParE family toxin [Methanomethylophilus alvi]|uniref:type II toxin-antitoxin system RelE/ParE family toxin n=1 Tax=Methanomethylophilus alvi TaxID=1291540 RepID=UPI0037DCD203